MANINLQIEKLNKELAELKSQYNIQDMSILQRQELEQQRQLYESSFYEFVKAAWPVAEGREQPFMDNWHIKALCDHMQATFTMDIMKLIINYPPRCSKSTVLMMFPCWAWTTSPHESFTYVSYSQDLIATRDSRRCRDLITSPWYQKLWGHKVKLRKDANTIKRFYNTAGGFRLFTSFSSNITGEGSSWIIFEDPNDKESIFSALARDRTNMEYDGGFSSRVSRPGFTRKVISQQRLHMLDLSGYVLSKDNAKEWVHLSIPMEYVPSKPCITVPLPGTNGKPWQDPRKREGELLWDAFWTAKAVQDQKNELRTTFNIQTQLQQSPANDEGNVIKRAWWRIWDDSAYPECNHVVMSWDTSFGAEDGSYSACTVWGIFDHPETDIPNIILLNAWRGRVLFPELRYIVKRMHHNYFDTQFDYEEPKEAREPDTLIIEAKATGSPLIQELAMAGIMAIPFDPLKEGRYTKKAGQRYNPKELRAHHASSLIEAGRCWLPAKPGNKNHLRSFAEDFLGLVCAFPAAGTSDYVDSMSQALMWIKKSRMTWMPHDEQPIDMREAEIWKSISVEKGSIY